MSRTPEKDLFNKSTMSFGDHLEELRTCLFRAVVGIILGFLVGLIFANQIVVFIQGPLTKALKEYYLELEKEEIKQEYGENAVERLALIEDQGLEVDTMRIDLDALAINLQKNQQGGFLTYKPYSFTYDDFLDPGAVKNLFSRVAKKKAEVVKQEKTGDDAEKQGKGDAKEQGNDDAEKQGNDDAEKQGNGDAEKQGNGDAEEQGNGDAEEQGNGDAEEQGNGDAEKEMDSVSPVAHLGSLLNEDAHAGANRAAEATPDQLQKDEKLRQETVAILNGWVARENLSRSPSFKKFIDEHPQLAEIRDELSNRSSDSNARTDARRLNRLVICEVFKDCLRPAQPQLLNVPLWKPIDIRVQTLNAHEAFMIWLKAAFICGFLIASPWVFYQVWSFIAAGLYSHEKKYVGIYLPLSLALFLGGAALAFFFVFEPVLDFLFGFNRAMNIHPDPRISEWMGFVLFLPIGFGVAFQLPLVMLMLHRIGLISVDVFVAKWRVAVLVICIVSMLLTPADPISMLLMAVPLVVLYFFGIGLAIWMPRIKNPYSEGYDPS